MNIGILGLGKTGLAAIEFFKKDNHVIAYDDFADHKLKLPVSDEAWNKLDMLLVSPGVMPTHPLIEKCQSAGIKITSDIEILYKKAAINSKFIAITGANGKSTTTSLTAHIFKEAKVKSTIGGNIGLPVLSLDLSKSQTYILELSSFQIDLLNNIQIDIGAILNITPNHLDRYDSFDDYVNSKAKLISFSKKMVLNYDDPVTKKLARSEDYLFSCKTILKQGFSLIDSQIYINGKIVAKIPKNLYLLGEHNQENIIAAFAICYLSNIKIENIVSAIASFKGLKHRMEFIAEKGGVKFFNDSKATTATAVSKALSSFEKDVMLIMGGKYKNDDLEPLKPYLSRVKKIYLIGDASSIFKKEFGLLADCEECGTLESALELIKKEAHPGTNVVLSPACASYDQFKNFEERGEKFRELVLAL